MTAKPPKSPQKRANRRGATIDANGTAVIPAPQLRLLRTPPVKLATLRHVREELSRLYRAARVGKIPTSDATRLGYLLAQIRDTIMAEDIEKRLESLEATHEKL